MSNFSSLHIITACDSAGVKITQSDSGGMQTVTIKHGNHHVDLTLSPEHFAEVIAACTQAMEAARAEAMA